MTTTAYSTPETDVLEESSMSFLDHLDELRSRLIRSVSFLMVAFILCWIFSDQIYHFLEIPVRAAMLEARRAITTSLSPDSPPRLVDLADGTSCTFDTPVDVKIGSVLVPAGTTLFTTVQRAVDGFPELVTRETKVISTEAVIPEGIVIPRALISPSAQLQSPDSRLVVGTVQGAFNLYIKVAFYGAIFFSVPFLLIQAWGFISPGLYPHEKKYAFPFIALASICFIAGCAFAYYFAFPRAANFLLGVAQSGNLRPLVTADDYFDLILTIMLGLGLVFEMPTVTYFLARLGLVTPQLLMRFWRFAVVAILIVAALLSPTTDIPNLLVFAAPMLILYFVSVGIAWLFHRKREKTDDAYTGVA